MTTFNDSLQVFETKDAARYAGALFQEAFNSAFPVPVAYRILDTQIQPDDWRQFVAIYTWPDGTAECVGFCNFITYKDVYLEGGLAVQKKLLPQVDEGTSYRMHRPRLYRAEKTATDRRRDEDRSVLGISDLGVRGFPSRTRSGE